MVDTVRLGILQHIKTLYDAATDEDPAPVGKRFYGIAFSVVEIGPLGDPDARKHYSVGIVAGDESKTDLFPLKWSTLPVKVEFRGTRVKEDDPPAIFAEKLLGVVQQVIYDDQTLGGRVVDVRESSNTVDLLTYSDRTVQGMVEFMVEYRHNTQSVYDPDPSV